MKINGQEHSNKKFIEKLVLQTNKEISAWSAAKLQLWLEESWCDNPKNFMIKSGLTYIGHERVAKMLGDKYRD